MKFESSYLSTQLLQHEGLYEFGNLTTGRTVRVCALTIRISAFKARIVAYKVWT